MKVVILAGGLGTRLAEEVVTRPKPMVEIGGRPILWHIMKTYSHYGHNDFIICLGYLGYVVKEYFSNYFMHMSDVTFDLAANRMEVHRASAEPWRVTLIDTGLDSMTGGRLKRVMPLVANEEVFAFTYGDGLADIDLSAQLAFHRAHRKQATVTAVHPMARFGALTLDGDQVVGFQEKPEHESGWINGGFFLLSPKVAERLVDDETVFEHGPMEGLARDGEMKAFFHHGFWQPMDTLRDKRVLEAKWATGAASWKVW